jgi:hypothetical protein
VETNPNSNDSSKQDVLCAVTRLTWWRTEHCYVTGACNGTWVGKISKDLLSCPDTGYNWRGDTAKNRSTDFDVGVGLSALSLVCALIAGIGFFIRCCCKDSTGKNYLLIFCVTLGFVLLAGSVGYFSAHLPKAYAADFSKASTCSSELPMKNTEGPCSTFFGTQDMNIIDSKILDTRIDIITYWGPVGWIVGVCALPVYLIVFCLSCTRAGGYSSINNDNYYVRQEATGTRYV